MVASIQPTATSIDLLARTGRVDAPAALWAMVEIVSVLERAYRLTPHEIVGSVERMLQTDVLVVENEQEVFTAMIALKDGQGSFADAVIAALGARMGCSSTLTFDRKALRLRGFELP
jgi:predicted nucleic-acid-binding protein